MSVGRALRRAVADFYHQSWRLVLLNSVVGAALAVVVLAALWAPPLVLLAVLLGPLAAALMHCAVTLAQTEELLLADALAGLRLHWRRGLGLGGLVVAVVGLGVFAAVFYAERGTWFLSIVVADLVIVFAVLQLVLWPLAVFERGKDLRALLVDAARLLARRMGASFVLGFALLLVNVVGLAAAILPFLTLTIAYSFLAAAHFALPPSSIREA